MIAEILPLVLAMAADTAGSGSSSGSTQVIVAALGAGSIGAVFAAVITGLFTKRKLGAEATEIITKAASGVVESLNSEIVRVNAAYATVRAEQASERAEHAAELNRERSQFMRQLEARDRVLQLHVAWDMLVRAKLAEHDIEVPEPPPLKPPLLDFPTE